MVSDYISIHSTITLIMAIELTCVYVNDHLQHEYHTSSIHMYTYCQHYEKKYWIPDVKTGTLFFSWCMPGFLILLLLSGKSAGILFKGVRGHLAP